MKEALNIKLFTAEEIAEQLGISYLAIQRQLMAGRLKGIKISNRWYVSEDNFRSFLNGNVANMEPTSKGKHLQTKLITITHRCIICKQKVDPKEDLYITYEGINELHFCSKEHQREWNRKPATQKKKAPSPTAPSNAYRTKVEKFHEA